MLTHVSVYANCPSFSAIFTKLKMLVYFVKILTLNFIITTPKFPALTEGQKHAKKLIGILQKFKRE